LVEFITNFLRTQLLKSYFMEEKPETKMMKKHSKKHKATIKNAKHNRAPNA